MMDDKTMNYCLKLLDVQLGHVLYDYEGKLCNTLDNINQYYYYKGMKDMLEALATQSFTQDGAVVVENGKHSLAK